MRWWFAITMGWKHRKELNTFLVDQHKRIDHLSQITPKMLDDANVAILALDFDGVLAPHGALKPLSENEIWLRNLCQTIGEQRVVILSNKPNLHRRQYFLTHFPMILFMEGVRKKPYPDGLEIIAEYKGVSPHRLALLDDRLLTGMLASCLAYTQGYYFINPCRKGWKRPITENFFSFLRIMERGLVRLWNI